MDLALMCWIIYLFSRSMQLTTRDDVVKSRWKVNWYTFGHEEPSNNYKIMVRDPNVISATNQKCVAHFEATQHGFPCTNSTSPRANQHGNMLCNLTTWHSFWPVENRASQNINLKTWTLKLTTHQNMSSFNGWLDICFDVRAAQAPKTHPHWELCFNPMHPSYMFPHAIPIRDILDLFQLSHISSNFC
jgi:hypothetical protein